MKIQHPNHDLERDVPDSAADRWLAAGWIPAEPTSEDDGNDGRDLFVLAPCPICGAVGVEPCTSTFGEPTEQHPGRTLVAVDDES